MLFVVVSCQLEFKDAYNKFKRDTTVIFILFPRQYHLPIIVFATSLTHIPDPHPSTELTPPAIPVSTLVYVVVQLLFPPQRVIFQLHQLWLLYYYFTLSLRENILYANGSSMKKWWIFHHYVSICITLLILLYPLDFLDPPRHTRLMIFGLAQGAVMACQFLYQSKRAYVRKTLGKAKSIDVDATETLVEKPTDLKWLVPILYALYLYEGYIGVDLFTLFFREEGVWRVWWGWENRPWHLVGIGLGCGVLAVGNSITTTLVLVSKQHMRKWRKMIRSREKVEDTPNHTAPARGEKQRVGEGKGEKVEGKPSTTAATASVAGGDLGGGGGVTDDLEGLNGEEETTKRKVTRRKK